jgi:hypothetical protein
MKRRTAGLADEWGEVTCKKCLKWRPKQCPDPAEAIAEVAKGGTLKPPEEIVVVPPPFHPKGTDNRVDPRPIKDARPLVTVTGVVGPTTPNEVARAIVRYRPPATATEAEIAEAVERLEEYALAVRVVPSVVPAVALLTGEEAKGQAGSVPSAREVVEQMVAGAAGAVDKAALKELCEAVMTEVGL